MVTWNVVKHRKGKFQQLRVLQLREDLSIFVWINRAVRINAVKREVEHVAHELSDSLRVHFEKLAL